jgi:hypothetical protein
MSDLNADALHVSQVLDENTGRLEGRFAPQERVHAALSRRSAIPSQRPSADISARVMARIGTPRAKESPRAVWPLGLAASLTLLTGLGWLLSHSTVPGHITIAPRPMAPATVTSGFTASGTLSALVNPLGRSNGQLQASIEEPFVQQAKLIREDTQQGVDMVLSCLPLSSASAAK